ncbi:hypothetical protein MF672_005595 [Actinomadura sp. ATCC 31491]|uniref:Uncharacterized protein n=1 Tax=Actinomadura luzonensis TaxID=2805427 RepID=A0ABT0FMW5_9ACTN|nr:hypothetical protein [Actinomadura luzonensis]MCK2213271.1 hypothetical protein [Actinomadura luzonensis]
MTALGPRAVLVPDLGEDLARAVEELETLLLTLRAAEEAGHTLPGSLANGTALTALRRLWRALAPTQGRRAAAARLAGRLYGPGRRREHLPPLRLVDVDPLDVATLSAAAAALGRGAARSGVVREALRAGGARYSGSDLVSVAAGISGLLDLADTAESIVLRERLAEAGPGADVVLTPAVEQAYHATAHRLNAMWPRP